MKFTIHKEDLLYAVTAVEKAVSNKNTLPVLEGILIEAEQGKLIFRATDLDLAMECIVPGEVIEAGKVVMPGKRFAAMARLLPMGPVTFREREGRLQVEYEGGQQNLPFFPAEEFPLFPMREGQMEGSIPASLFRRLVRRVGIAAANDEVRPIFTSVFTEFHQDNLVMVATDTHRLAWGEGRWQASGEPMSLLLPNRALQEVARLAQGDEDEIIITASRSQVFFSFANLTITTRVIMGQYPDYQQVIPDPSTVIASLMLSRTQLAGILERASLISRDVNRGKGHVVRLETQEDALIISAEAADEGAIREQVKVESSGQPILVNFNAKYLLDAIKALDDDMIRLQLTGEATPGLILPEQDQDYLYLLLPIRIGRSLN